jgi:hypothetical protein
LGEIVDGETLVLKLCLALPEFPVARPPDETNDRFCVRVELAAKNVMRGYARGEHDVCIASVPNEGRCRGLVPQVPQVTGYNIKFWI